MFSINISFICTIHFMCFSFSPEQMVLAACTVITQSFPQPDEYEIPEVGLGRRAQYYVLHDDGNFKYGYDTKDGAYESVVKMGSTELSGFYGYKDPFGEKVHIDYTAGTAGFRPTGNTIPVAESSLKPVSQNSDVLFKSGQSSSPTTTVEESNVKSENNIDGSYSFSYDNSDSARRESADASNNVVGEYSFIADNGQNYKINYRAGSQTGFLADGDSIPVVPEAPAISEPVVLQPTSYSAPIRSSPSTLYSVPLKTNFRESLEPRNDASYSFKYKTDDSSREENADSDLNVKGHYSFIGDDGLERNIKYIAGSGTGFVATGIHLPVVSEKTGNAPIAPLKYSAPIKSPLKPLLPVDYVISPSTGGDASYQFSYQTEDSSRSETSDRDLNVRGDYSFVADDGKRRTVNYVAGSSTGFLAEGDHLPVSPEIPVVRNTVFEAPSPSVLYSVPQPQILQVNQPQITNEPRGDASYQYNYNAGDSARSETSDRDLNIQGKYSFIGDDGVERTVHYKAGSGIGFVAEGSHLPVASEDGIVSQSTGFTSVPRVSEVSPLLKTSDSDSKVTNTQGVQRGYSFSYTNSDSSRSESSDVANNVVGEYTYVAGDGQKYKINYKAGSGIGFVAEGDSVPKVPVPEASRLIPLVPSQTYFTPVSSSVSESASPTIYSVGNTNTQSNVQPDGSYSFSYTNSDSARSETADSSNNVIGRYSFVADDGINREVQYKAGSATGFVAIGDHLPEVASVADTSSKNVATPIQYYAAPQSSQSALADDQQGSDLDASYHFSYQNEDSAREETSDKDLNVKGRFSFVSDDGLQRTVNYIAGSTTGFIAEGDHLPVSVPVNIVSSPDFKHAHIPAPSSAGPIIFRSGYNYKAPQDLTLSLTSSNVGSAIRHSGSSSTGSVRETSGYNYAAPAGPTFSSSSPKIAEPQSNEMDASYHFSYQNEDSAREETSDKDLNVKGRFSFVADDGLQRTVNYIAGSSTGFVAEGDHLPVSVPANIGSSPSFKSVPSPAPSSSRLVSASSGYNYATPEGATLSLTPSKVGSVTRYTDASDSDTPSQGLIVGNVKLRQYNPVNRSKYGYVFTEI